MVAWGSSILRNLHISRSYIWSQQAPINFARKTSLKLGGAVSLGIQPQLSRLVAMVMSEGSLEVKLPAIWTDGKAEVGRVREEKRRVLRGWRKVFLHLVESEQNVRICSSFKKKWQAWDTWRGNAKMHFQWQAQYKRHVHQRCYIGSPGADFLLHFGASDLQIWEDDFVWQVQHFVWPGITFSWQAQYFGDMDWKNRKTHWHEAVSLGSLAELLGIWC